jgi:2-C-methyl-D-erythritol 4-phosphate cytidylyltransferase
MSSQSIPVWAIVPASGAGLRLQGQLPKQYLLLDGKPIITHTLDRLLSFDAIDGVVLVLKAGDKHWKDLNYQSEKPVLTATGGAQRQDSVHSGLQSLLQLKLNNLLVMVHDAVRPLVSHEDLGTLLEAAIEHEAGALLALPVADTLKQQDENCCVDRTVAREGLWRAMTPQVFGASLLGRAIDHARHNNLELTDDASAIEMLGMNPRLVTGSADNIKITYPGDLALAQQILQSQRELADS